MILIGKIAVGTLGTIALAGAIVSSEGFIHVKVHENATNGTHLSFVVPAMLVPATLEFVPRKYLQQPAEQMRPYLPLLDAAISGLNDCADGTTLVEVTEPDQHAKVTISGGSLVVDVEDPDETVHTSVPLRVVRSAIHAIASSAGPS